MSENRDEKAGGPLSGSTASAQTTSAPGQSANLSLDPHAQSAEHGLRPDPKGLRDPILGGHSDPHERSGDFSLRPDPTGSRDPLSRAHLDPHAVGEKVSRGGDWQPGGTQTAGGAADLAARATDKAAELADQARDRAAGIASDLHERVGGAAEDARKRASAVYEDARSWATETHEKSMRRIDDLHERSLDGLNRGRTNVENFVTDNPLLVGVVGVAAGLLLGALLPRTRQEDRNIGPLADEVRDQGLKYAREFTNRGREFVQTALDPDNINAAARKVAEDNGPVPPAGERTAHRL